MTAGTNTDHVSPREIGELAQAVRGLSENVGALGGQVDALRADLNNNYVRKDVLEPTLEIMNARIETNTAGVQVLTDWMRWAIRIVLAIVITAVLGLVLKDTGVI